MLLYHNVHSHVSGYCDVDWTSCPQTTKFIPGYLMKIGDSVMSWKSTKQTIVSRSSTEAEAEA